MTSNNNKNAKNRPKLKLPFTKERLDIGDWAFIHRAGLCVTIIIYLALSIGFVVKKIDVGAKPHTQGFYIELEDVETLEEEKKELEEQIQEKLKAQEQMDWSRVSNHTSNETSLEKHVVNSQNNTPSEINREAQRIQDNMEANRKAYEQGLEQIDSERKAAEQQTTKEQTDEHRDIKRSGNVTVSYSFTNPTRHAQSPIIVPAYQCHGGGEIVVTVQVDRSGKVLSSKVAKGSDRCMEQTAIKSANRARFNNDATAPERQSGTITYIFIPQ